MKEILVILIIIVIMENILYLEFIIFKMNIIFV